MKQYTIGTFATHESAEQAVTRLQEELEISPEEVSYVYRNLEGDLVDENDSEGERNMDIREGTTQGAAIGGGLGALAGIVAVAATVPVVGPIFAAGPIVSALGIGAGALGTTAAGAITGAAAGGIVGALVSWGVSQERAEIYQEQVAAGSILIAVHAEQDKPVVPILEASGAIETEVYPYPGE